MTRKLFQKHEGISWFLWLFVSAALLIGNSLLLPILVYAEPEHHLTLKSHLKEDELTLLAPTDVDNQLAKELAGRIEKFDNVRSAWLHFTMQETENGARPSAASIMISIPPKKIISNENVAAIVKLVQSAVPYLKKNKITIIDNHGNILSDLGNQPVGAKNYFRYKSHLEQSYQRKVTSVIDALTGIKKVSVQITLDIDYGVTNRGLNTAENTAQEVTSDVDNFMSTLADPTSILLPIGKLKRINLSVILPKSLNKNLNDEQIKTVIGDAIGLDQSRGDRITLIWNTLDTEPKQNQISMLLQHMYSNILLSTAIFIMGILLLWLIFNWHFVRGKVHQSNDNHEHHPDQVYETLSFLKQYPSNIIARILAEEHPQVIASLLVVLPEREANRILAHLSEPLQNDCIKRMNSIDTINPEALSQIAAALQATLTTWQLRQQQNQIKRDYS